MSGDGAALTRLGGGRWRTKDGRFTIEPQGGSWVVVDGEQTDDLGMAMVRGPFGSLAAARRAIDDARAGEAPVSPLTERIEQAKDRPPTEPAATKRPVLRRAPTARAARPQSPERPRPPEPQPPPEPPPEPDWIVSLLPARRRTARAVIERLTALGIADPETIARAEVELGEPALARLALERAIIEAVSGHPDRESAVAAVVALLTAGEDTGLGVRWHLVDGEGRPIDGVRVAHRS